MLLSLTCVSQRDPDDTSDFLSVTLDCTFQAVDSQSVGPRSKDLEMLDVGPCSGSDPVGFSLVLNLQKEEATEAPVERNSSQALTGDGSGTVTWLHNEIIAPCKSFATSLVPQCSTWPKWAYVSYLMQKISIDSGLDEAVVTSFHHVILTTHPIINMEPQTSWRFGSDDVLSNWGDFLGSMLYQWQWGELRSKGEFSPFFLDRGSLNDSN